MALQRLDNLNLTGTVKANFNFTPIVLLFLTAGMYRVFYFSLATSPS